MTRKNRILLTVCAVIATVLLLILCLLWPHIRSAASVRRLEDGLYSMKYTRDYGLDAVGAR